MKRSVIQDQCFRIIGQVILCKTKLRLHELIYKHIKPVFKEAMTGVFINTDSFMAEIIDLDERT